MKSRFFEEQIIRILKEHEPGTATGELCRCHGISRGTFYKWKDEFSGMEVSDARKLKALEVENARLKRLVAHYSEGRQLKKVVTPQAKCETDARLGKPDRIYV